jgi:hypothetical protein
VRADRRALVLEEVVLPEVAEVAEVGVPGSHSAANCSMIGALLCRCSGQRSRLFAALA